MWKNVYLFSGAPFLIEQKVKSWKEAFMKKHDSDLNLVQLYCEKENDLDTMVQEVESLPFLSPFKLVFLKGVLEGKGRSSEEGNEEKSDKASDRLEKALETSPESSIIVFVSPAPDKRKRLYKKIIQENIKHFEIDRKGLIGGFDEKREQLSVSEFFFEHFARQIPKDLISQTIRLLGGTNLAELDLFLVYNELEKIQLLGLSQKITSDDIDMLVDRGMQHKIFDFTNALGLGKSQQALLILDSLLTSGEDIYALWGLLTAHFARLVRVKVLLTEKKGPDSIRSFLGNQAFKANDFIEQANSFSVSGLSELHAMLLSTDIKLKTGGITISTNDTTAFQFEIEKCVLRFASAKN